MGTSGLRAQASKVLQAAARKYGNSQLAAVAYQVKLDAFTKVKKAISDLVAELEKQNADEIKQKDFCKEEFHKNKVQTVEKTDEMSDLKAKITDRESLAKELTKAIAALKGEIKEMQVQLKKAGEDREQQNVEYQKTVADQRATRKLLKAALVVLQDVYGKEDAAAAAAFDQQADAPPPPPGFKEYKQTSSGGVTGLLKQIIEDTKAVEAEATRAEEDSQKAYEDFVQDTNASVEAKGKDIVNKSEAKAKAESELIEARKELESASLDMENLQNTKTELHQTCDFVLKNFDLRQKARTDEVEALRQAMAILSGSKF